MKKIFYTFILLFYFSSNVFAQVSTEGKDFWMGFMENFGTPQSLRLFITSKKNTTAQVVMPLAGYNSGTLTINANQTKEVLLPVSSAHTTGQGLRTSGVHITSNDTISVFAINNLQNTTDATVVLPTKALGIKPTYIVSSYQGNTNSEFLIVATEDNTPVKITYLNGTTENITLSSAGNTYQIQSATDLSGTIIEGTDPCKTFAVFAGAVCINIPQGEPRCDHIYDQLFPIGTWDKEYIVTPFGAGRDLANKSLEQVGGYIIKLFRTDNITTAAVNGTNVNWNGKIAEINVSDFTPRCISASAPISAVQFMKSQNVNGLPKYITDENGNPNALAKGDPSMLVLNPNSQTVSSTVFNTVTTPNLSDHFVNVIIKTADKGTLKLDGVTVANNKFFSLPSCNTYSYAILQITNGSHKLDCPNGLIAYCYGVGERESYAYSAGASFDNIKYKFTVQDDYSISTDGDASSCTITPINFSGIGENVLAWKWDFGDGSPIVTGQNVIHTYNAAGNYQVKMSVTLADGCATRDVEIFRQINIILFPAPNLGVSQQVYCSNSFVTLDAGEFGSNNKYLWSNGATTRTIDVNTVGSYSVKVTNTVGCNATSATIQVSQVAAPIVSFTTLSDSYCINAPAFDLISVVNPTNNPSATTFTINNVTATSFNPAALGAGTHTVVFNYQDPITFCSNQASKQVVVKALPVLSFVNLPDFYCINDATVDLFSKVSPSNTTIGSFKVNGVNTSTFNPSASIVGTDYLIEYTYTDPSTTCKNTISKTITIKALPTVGFTALANSYCINASAINLFDMVSPSNTSTGVFKAGTTILTTAQAQSFAFASFPPNQNITIEYAYADPTTLCQNKTQKDVLVKALPVLSFPTLADSYCINVPAFDLISVVNPTNNPSATTFTINTITATSFNPAALGAGTHTVVFNYQDPITFCSNQASKQVVVKALPVLSFVNLPDFYCINDATVDLFSKVSPSNTSTGSFKVNGVNTSTFNPAASIVGTDYLIEYAYTDPSTTCKNTISKTITIKDLPTVSFTALANSYCINASAINLFEMVSPSNTSTGVFKAGTTTLTTAQAQNFSFASFPANQNITIEYAYTDPTTLCQNKTQKDVLVKALPVLSFVDLKDVYCQQDAAFNLFDKVTPSSNAQGNFTINGLSATSFNPATEQAGKNYLIKYTYTDPISTCTNQIEKNISIPNLPAFVDLGDAYCQDFGLVALKANPAGGTFKINGSIVTELNPALYTAGNILVSYTDAGNCAVISKEVEIIVPPSPIYKANEEDICSQFGEEEPIIIDAGEGLSYRWVHSQETTKQVKITKSGTYTVEVLNELNCTEIRNIIVSERFDCNPRIFMPTAFSPNGDGLNEELEVFGKYFTDFKITIYNRWGEVVFQSKDRYQLWNGTLGGQNAIEGVYTAIVEYRFLNTTKIEKRQSKVILVR